MKVEPMVKAGQIYTDVYGDFVIVEDVIYITSKDDFLISFNKLNSKNSFSLVQNEFVSNFNLYQYDME